MEAGGAPRRWGAAQAVSHALAAVKRFVPILWTGQHPYTSRQLKRGIGPYVRRRGRTRIAPVYTKKKRKKYVAFLITLAASYGYSR